MKANKQTRIRKSTMQTVKVRLDGPGGMTMPEKALKAVYASGVDFEPDERRMTAAPDGAH